MFVVGYSGFQLSILPATWIPSRRTFETKVFLSQLKSNVKVEVSLAYLSAKVESHIPDNQSVEISPCPHAEHIIYSHFLAHKQRQYSTVKHEL